MRFSEIATRCRPEVEHDAELAGGQFASGRPAVSPDLDGNRLVALGHDLEVVLLVQRLAVVSEQDIAGLQAVGRGVGARDDHVDQQAVVGQRLGVARLVGLHVDRVAQGQQAGMAVGPGLCTQVLEHGGRGGIAHGAGVVGASSASTGMPAMAREGRTISLRAGGRPSRAGWPRSQGLGQRVETLGA